MKTGFGFKWCAIILLSMSSLSVETQANADSQTDKSKAEIDTIIEKTGSTAPDWWDSVELGIPETLDMNWPVRTGFQQGRGGFRYRGGRGAFGGRGGRGGFGGRARRGPFAFQGGPAFSQDNSRSVDQYLVQVIYPNAPRYKAGIKLVNYLMIMHKDDRQKLVRSLSTLGDLFYDLLGDYARAAFWWQKSAEMGGSIDSLKLARCYFELGSKSAAYELLAAASSGYRGSNREAIKFWASIGEVDNALEMIESSSQGNNMGLRYSSFRRGGSQNADYMLAAEICRTAGRYEQAAGYYEKALASMSNSFTGFRGSSGNRATTNLEVVKLLNKLNLGQIPDGTYTGSAMGYGGNLYIRLAVAKGRIMSVEVTQHRETYSYFSRAVQTARQIVSKQGFKGVDAVSGATITSDAIINAAARALASAAK